MTSHANPFERLISLVRETERTEAELHRVVRSLQLAWGQMAEPGAPVAIVHQYIQHLQRRRRALRAQLRTLRAESRAALGLAEEWDRLVPSVN